MVWREKAKQITWLVFDIDGVFTDGKLYFSPDGDFMKAFYVQDGLGIELARKSGLKIAILTARASDIVLRRAMDLKVDELIQGAKNKGEAIENLAEKVSVSLTEMAYMGDDLIDLPAIRRAGISASPSDGVAEVRERVDWVADYPGGRGAIRQWVEEVLKAQGKWDEAVSFYSTL